MIRIKFLFGLAMALIVFACDNSKKTTGNTMETENSVAFQIILPDGETAESAAYILRPAWYLSDTNHITGSDSIVRRGFTDKDGWVRILDLPIGSYVLELVDESVGGAYSFQHSRTVGPEAQYQIILDTLGAVQGRVALPDGVEFARVQIYGLAVAVNTEEDGSFVLGKLPVGKLRLTAWSPVDNKVLAETEFTVISGDTLGLGLLSIPASPVEDPVTWTYERPLNASDLVPEWMRPLTFPTVVTLYLDSSRFDFREANADGSDLRVFTAAGNKLLLDRVRWDSAAGLAVVRIRIDDASDTLDAWRLCWGKSLAFDLGRPDVWEGLSDSTILALNSVLVDDFEDGTAQNFLPEPISRSYWFQVRSDTSVMLDPGPGDDFALAIQDAGAGGNGMAIHIHYTVPSPHWALIGTSLGKGPHSLFSMDSVEFWVKGNGEYSVAFENNSGDSLGKKAWIHLSCDSLWTRVAFTPADFDTVDTNGGNIGWEAIRDSVTNISVFLGAGSDFWIDDIRLYGISRNDLL